MFTSQQQIMYLRFVQRVNKKAVLSQRWLRDAHKWIEWAVAEIWPFEIIQRGGLPPTWIWCNRK